MGIGLVQGKKQDRRPTDWAYKATFQEKDLPSLQDMIKKINTIHDVRLIQEFNAKCEQKLSGQNVTIEGVEIQTVAKTGDLVVNGGLRHCLNIILGTTSARWSHFGMGLNNVVTINDTALGAETIATRVSLAWAEPIGMRLFFGAISSQTDGFSPNLVVELGVYNGSAAGAILLNHSAFEDRPSQNIVGSFSNVQTAPIVVSAVIEFCPVA